MLTFFTIPKPFTGAAADAQRNALASWARLGDVQVIVCGDEEGTAGAVRELGLEHVAGVERNEFGTPLLDSAFALAQERARHGVTCYANADLLFFPDFPHAVTRVAAALRRFLIVGETWDVAVDGDHGASDGHELAVGGTPRPARWIDFFAFPTGSVTGLPPFAVGRPAWDNWMIYRARRSRTPVVDVSRSTRVIHQSHGYAHVPHARASRWEGPEGDRNLALLGVPSRSDFSLRDATHHLTDAGIERAPQEGMRRRLRTFMLVTPGLAHAYDPLRSVARLAQTGSRA